MKYYAQKKIYEFRWFIIAALTIITLPYTIPSGAMGMFIVLMLPYVLLRHESRRRFRESCYKQKYFPDNVFSNKETPSRAIPPVPMNPYGKVDCVFENAHKILIRQDKNGKFYAFDDNTMKPLSGNLFPLPIQAKWEIMRTYPNALIVDDYY